MCRQEVLYLCEIFYCFFLVNILLFVVQSISCQELGTCFSLSSQLQPQEAGKCHCAVLLQEFNTDLLVVVYSVDKTAHTHTLSLPSSLSHPLQSVGQPLGQPDIPQIRSDIWQTVIAGYYMSVCTHSTIVIGEDDLIGLPLVFAT